MSWRSNYVPPAPLGSTPSTSQPSTLPTAPTQLLESKIFSCNCACFQKPYWNIENIGGLYDTNNSNTQVPLERSHLQARVVNSVIGMEYTQVYKNQSKSPMEVIYKFPIEKSFSVTGVQIKMDDKEIDAVIMRKEEAKEKYDDAVAQGNTAAKINYDEHVPEVLELAIGAIQPGKEVQICVNMTAKCDVTKHGNYSFIFPLNFIPNRKSSSESDTIKGHISGAFSADITLESSGIISDLSVSHSEMTFEQDESRKKAQITLPESSEISARDIVVSYSTDSIREPQVTLHESSKHPDEILAHINCIPRISDIAELEEDEIPAEIPDSTQQCPTAEYDIASGEFIFVLDRSGSMGGSRIKIAREALKLFIKSLPSNSKFNVVGFGTRLDIMHPQSVEYSQENIDDALAKIELMKSDLGGTNLSTPLNEIYNMPIDYKYPRSIFVLTDGNISDTDEVMKKVRSHNNFGRVHSFGIGKGASKYLVTQLAKVGYGTSAMIEDNDPNTKAKVIEALNQASRPAFSNIQLNWGSNTGAIQFEVPREPIFGFVYEEEALDLYAVLKKSELQSDSLTLSFFNTFDQEETKVSFDINPESIVNDGDDDSVFKLAARENMVHYERLETQGIVNKEDPEITKIVTQLSLDYSVLSPNTAFFGKIKNKDKSGEELVTVEIPIRKVVKEDPYIRSSYISRSLQSNQVEFYSKKKKKLSSKGFFGIAASAIGGLFGGGIADKGIVTMSSGPMRSAKRSSGAMRPDMAVMRCAAPTASAPQASAGAPDLYSFGAPSSIESCMDSFTPVPEDSCSMPMSKNKEMGKRKKNKKKKEKSAPMEYTPPSSLEGYERLIQYQSPDGHFSQLSDDYSELALKSAPETLSEAVKDIANLDSIWLTILALYILETKYKSSKGEWIMISKKAKSYLKKTMTKESDYRQFYSFIS